MPNQNRKENTEVNVAFISGVFFRPVVLTTN